MTHAARDSRPATRTAAAVEAERTVSRGGRDPYWDNVRCIAITLVVIGHTIESLSAYDAMYALYLWVYAFHMPLFALASGFFARAEPVTRVQGGKVVAQLLAPYVIFSAIWAVVRWLYHDALTLDLGNPYWYLWFLTALAAWRLTLPVLAALRFPLLCAIGISVASGYMSTVGWRFEASRTLGFLPFFVLGWWLRQNGRWERVSTVGSRGVAKVVALALLIAAAAASVVWVDAARAVNLRAWFQLEKNYLDMGVHSWVAGLVRLALLVASLILCLAIMVIVPRRRTVLSGLGRVTMYIYLLHLFPVYALRQTGLMEAWFSTGPRQAGLIVAAIVLTCLLGGRFVVRGTRWLVEPPWAARLLVPAARG